VTSRGCVPRCSPSPTIPEPASKTTSAPVVSSSIGPISGFGANHHLRQSLAFLDMPTLQQPEMYLGSVGDWFDEDGSVKNEKTRAFLGQFAAKFAAWIERTAPKAKKVSEAA